MERHFRRPDARDIELAGQAFARRIPLYAFSNSNRTHELYWSKRFADVLGHFRQVYVSSTIRMRKPSVEAFDHVVKAIGVPAERIVFFDDVLENIAGARASRLQAVHVTTSADVANALTALLAQPADRTALPPKPSTCDRTRPYSIPMA